MEQNCFQRNDILFYPNYHIQHTPKITLQKDSQVTCLSSTLSNNLKPALPFPSSIHTGHFTKTAPICPTTSAEQEVTYLSRTKMMKGDSSQSQRQGAGEGRIQKGKEIILLPFSYGTGF